MQTCVLESGSNLGANLIVAQTCLRLAHTPMQWLIRRLLKDTDEEVLSDINSTPYQKFMRKVVWTDLQRDFERKNGAKEFVSDSGLQKWK